MKPSISTPFAMRMSIKSCFMSLFFRTTKGRRMVDTIKVRFIGKPHAAVPPRRPVKLTDGVRFWHDGEGNCKVEAELPKLLWGHNGCLLASQENIDVSVAKLRAVVLQYVEFSSWQLVFIDLVWQFRTRPADVILAHQWLRFRGVKKLPSLLYGDKEISWRGARLMLKFYDKAKGVLRVELRLAGAQLRKRIDADALLDFTELYRVFRTEVLKLSPIQLPEARKHSTAEIIAKLPLKLQNEVVLTYQQGRTARAVSGFKRDVSIARIKRVGWNLCDLLPANNPPPPVNCEPRKHPAKRFLEAGPVQNGSAPVKAAMPPAPVPPGVPPQPV
jgi:hypothetical protein